VSAVSAFADLPAEIQQASNDSGGNEYVRGVVHNDTFHLIAGNHISQQSVEETMFHEAYGHLGLNAMFGKGVRVKMNELFIAIGGSKGLITLAKKHGINLTSYAKRLSKMQHGGKISIEVRNAAFMSAMRDKYGAENMWRNMEKAGASKDKIEEVDQRIRAVMSRCKKAYAERMFN